VEATTNRKLERREMNEMDRARIAKLGNLKPEEADVEAWEYALSILRPWVEAALAIGSDEFTEAMERAEWYALGEYYRAQDMLDQS
jgi:hypothetical protein